MLSYDTTVLIATSYTSYDPFTSQLPSAIKNEITSVTGEDVGTGDDTTTGFYLLYRPVISGSDTVYLDGVAQTRDIDYSIDYNTGKITFTTAPDTDVAITADYQYAPYVSVSYSKPSGQPGETGSMPLVQIGFLVEGVGETDLDVHDTKLTDSAVGFIIHEVVDGYFSNVGVPGDFSISADPTSLTVQVGGSDTSTITITSLEGFSDQVDLTISGVPSGVTASFDPPTVTPPPDASADSTMTLEVGATATPDVYTLTVTGTSGALSHDVSISLTIAPAAVPDFSISADPTSLTIVQGESDTSTVTVTSLEGFNSAVDLTISGLPADVTASFDPSSVTPPAGGSATSTLTIDVGLAAGPDTYTLTVTGTSGALEHSVEITLTITELPPEDTTPPIIIINEPTERDYVHSETITLDFNAEDPSGVASVTATLDGKSVMSGDEIELYTLPLGPHTLVVTAVDNVGNSGTETVTFNLIATVGSLQDLVYMFFQSGYFNSAKGMYTSLVMKLYAAEAYINAGQIDDAKDVLGAFINHLEAQSMRGSERALPKHVDPYAAYILIADAQYVIDNL
ncbi:MAG: DUF2460 domain-containing protein [Candidatus Bathyarchaeia archaeon]